MRPTSIRLAVLSEESLFREVVGAALNLLPGIDAQPSHLVASSTEPPPDIALVDVGHASTLQALREVREQYPRTIPIAYGVPDQQVLRVIEAGAVGYVLEDGGFDDLERTVRAVARGETVCSGRVARLLFDRLTELSRGRERWRLPAGAALSHRERQILELIALGLSNKEIAARLQIALYTVKNHVRTLLAKLRVHRRRDAVRAGYELGLIGGPARHSREA